MSKRRGLHRRAFLGACVAALVPACRAAADEPPGSVEKAPSATGGTHAHQDQTSPEPEGSGTAAAPSPSPTDPHEPRARVDPADYPSEASEWGERVTGVRTRLATDHRVVALTFDACGGGSGNGYDEELIDYLISADVPATLFFNQRWIDRHEPTFRALAGNSLFAIANHGSRHLPLSVSGRDAYGIAGTGDPAEVIEEVMANQETIERLTGRRPAWFRSGTAYCDEVAVRIAQDLGVEVVNYDVLGDAGATFSSAQVESALVAATPGSIALLHMNQPGSGTAAGVMSAVVELRHRGFGFVRLDDYPLE